MSKELPLEEIVKTRFGIHRGLVSEGNPANSLGAIRAAIVLDPPFAEFDVGLFNGAIGTGHPPDKPQDRLEEVLPLFGEKKTYPKVDIKLMGEPFRPVIDAALPLIKQTRINFVLVCFSTLKSKENIRRDYFMQAEAYFAEKVGPTQKIGLSIDLARYRPPRGAINGGFGIREHVGKLGGLVYCISTEIHEEDRERVAQFAQEHKIGQLHFWLRGWPDVPNPSVSEETLRPALALEDRYPVKVYFDLNPAFIEGFDWNPSSSG